MSYSVAAIKCMMAAMADGITTTSDLPQYALNRLFDRFSGKSLSDVDDRNNDDVGELSGRTGGGTDTDSGSIFDRYSDVCDYESDGVNPEDELRTVLSMLDDALLLEFDFVRKKSACESVNMQSLIGISPVAMGVLASIQISTFVIYVQNAEK